jgi:hypothetical protein
MAVFYPLWMGAATGVALFTLMDRDAHLYQKIPAAILVLTGIILIVGR